MAVTAKTRSQLALHATTSLSTNEVLAFVREAAATTKGGGKSLLTSGPMNTGARPHIEVEYEHGFAMSITSGKRLIELCTFSVDVQNEDSGTRVRIGGLETYKTTQSKFLFIPTGPKMIFGFDVYRRFLEHVAASLRMADPDGQVDVAFPVGAA